MDKPLYANPMAPRPKATPVKAMELRSKTSYAGGSQACPSTGGYACGSQASSSTGKAPPPPPRVAAPSASTFVPPPPPDVHASGAAMFLDPQQHPAPGPTPKFVPSPPPGQPVATPVMLVGPPPPVPSFPPTAPVHLAGSMMGMAPAPCAMGPCVGPPMGMGCMPCMGASPRPSLGRNWLEARPTTKPRAPAEWLGVAPVPPVAKFVVPAAFAGRVPVVSPAPAHVPATLTSAPTSPDPAAFVASSGSPFDVRPTSRAPRPTSKPGVATRAKAASASQGGKRPAMDLTDDRAVPSFALYCKSLMETNGSCIVSMVLACSCLFLLVLIFCQHC